MFLDIGKTKNLFRFHKFSVLIPPYNSPKEITIIIKKKKLKIQNYRFGWTWRLKIVLISQSNGM